MMASTTLSRSNINREKYDNMNMFYTSWCFFYPHLTVEKSIFSVICTDSYRSSCWNFDTRPTIKCSRRQEKCGSECFTSANFGENKPQEYSKS